MSMIEAVPNSGKFNWRLGKKRYKKNTFSHFCFSCVFLEEQAKEISYISVCSSLEWPSFMLLFQGSSWSEPTVPDWNPTIKAVD
jgi:hypothetical protein